MKKKKRRRRVRRNPVIHSTNRHHIFWQRRFWSKARWSYALRMHEFCIVELPISVHNAIHAEILTVPIPPEFICEKAVEIINHLWSLGAIGPDTPVQVRLDVLICILDYVATGTAYSLKEQKKILHKLMPHS